MKFEHHRLTFETETKTKQRQQLMVARDFKTRVLPVSKKLLRFATHFLKDEDEARDVVQDVFLKLWQKRDTLDEIENALTILINSGTKKENISLLHTNTEYPTPYHDVNLRAMLTIKNV